MMMMANASGLLPIADGQLLIGYGAITVHC